MLNKVNIYVRAGWGLAALMPLVSASPALSQRQTTRLESGTVFAVKLDDSLSSKNSGKGDTFTATVTNADGEDSAALPAGTKVKGTVHSAEPKNGKNPGMLDFTFDRVTLPGGRSYAISGYPISLDSKSVETRDGRLVAKKGHNGPNREAYVGIGAGAGLLINVLTNRKGTLLDTILGAGAGYGIGSLIKGGSSTRDVDLKSGTKVGVRLTRSLAYAR